MNPKKSKQDINYVSYMSIRKVRCIRKSKTEKEYSMFFKL